MKSEYRLAYVYDRKEELGDAIYYYEKAIEKNHTLSKYRLANLYNRENEIEKAKTYYKMVAEDDITEAKIIWQVYILKKKIMKMLLNIMRML